MITVCILLSGNMLLTLCMHVSVMDGCLRACTGEGRPTYHLSYCHLRWPSRCSYCVGASIQARTHTSALLPGRTGVWRTCMRCEKTFSTKHSINLLLRPCGNSYVFPTYSKLPLYKQHAAELKRFIKC